MHGLEVAVKILYADFDLKGMNTVTTATQLFVFPIGFSNEHLCGGYKEWKARGPSPGFLDCVSPGFSDNPREVGAGPCNMP